MQQANFQLTLPTKISSVPNPKPQDSIPSRRKTASSTLTCVALALTILFTLLVAVQSASAQTLTVLYSFTDQGDGKSPGGDLTMDAQGNLYGTTVFGGDYVDCPPNSCGVVYEITPSGQESTLYTFGGGTLGGEPQAGVIRDPRGNLYGTDPSFGANQLGLIFEVTPSTGAYKVLYTFAGKPAGGEPEGKMVRDGMGNFYGVTAEGGSRNWGTVFKLTPGGVETVLHNFVQTGDGIMPFAGLVRDAQGNLYGTTLLGGLYDRGTIYKVGAAGGESVLHSFSGFDGQNPYSPLVRDANGNLYGTTEAGGANGYGTVFVATSTGQEGPLYSFSGPDGQYPFNGLVRDSLGNLYGTTSAGGAFGYGTVFKVTPNGTETLLYSFTGGTDGSHPSSGLLMDAQGNFYGATGGGGALGFGEVYKLTP